MAALANPLKDRSLNGDLAEETFFLGFFGLEYAHAIPAVKEALTAYISSLSGEFLFADAMCSIISPSEASGPQNQFRLSYNQVAGECFSKGTGLDYTMGGLSWRLPEGRKMEDYLLFWIGFTNVLLTFNSCETVARFFVEGMDPKVFRPVKYVANEGCLVTDLSQEKKILKRRYYLVEKAKDSNMIGILVGTLGADVHEVEKDGVLALVNATEKALQIRDDNFQSVTKGTAKSGLNILPVDHTMALILM